MQTASPDWKNLVKLHSNYDGKIVDFCKLHNINVDSFYYYRKKYSINNKSTASTFHKIELNHTVSAAVTTVNTPTSITISIGSSIMTVPDTINPGTLTTIMKVLASC